VICRNSSSLKMEVVIPLNIVSEPAGVIFYFTPPKNYFFDKGLFLLNIKNGHVQGC
jgi:hypothetical protein